MTGARKTSKTEREVNKKSNLQLEFVNDSFARKCSRASQKGNEFTVMKQNSRTVKGFWGFFDSEWAVEEPTQRLTYHLL